VSAASTEKTIKTGWGRRVSAPVALAESLVFENVSHRYGATLSVDDVSLAIKPGEIVCLLGHSGCGKTTLLRVAAGLEPPHGGRVLIGGREMSGPSGVVAPEKRGVGLMFQDYALFPHMTILANVMFGLKALGRADGERAARAALARVGMERYAEDYPDALSGGEQQRVALARAMAPRPGVMLMDEPFSGLDRRLRDSVRDETLSVLKEAKATAVVVTHDPEEAMRMADRIVLMRAGRLVQVGTAEELYLAPSSLFAARFFSEINELAGVASGGGVETPIGRFASDAADGTAMDVCVRLQGVLLGQPGEGTPGRIVGRRFLGEAALVDVAVDGLDAPLRARVRAGDAHVLGNDVSVSADPRDVLVFPSQPG
jgi:iron(III) transport system ATP-binding protein